MALKVTPDIDDGPSVEITKDGIRTTRVHRVTGLFGNGVVRLATALGAPGIPKYGDFHPAFRQLPVGRILVALAPGSTDIATVTTEYFHPTGGNLHFANLDEIRRSRLPQLEITSTVQPSTTQLAYWLFPPGIEESWNPVWLKWRPLPVEGPIPDEKVPYQYQGGEINYQIPMMVFRYTRRESSEAYVGDKARAFVGTINSEYIFGNPDVENSGDAPRTWLCTRIDGVSDDGGQTYNTTYEFQYNPETWDPVIVFTDPETGKPVANPVWGESIRQVRVYRLADFFQIGLTIPNDR